MDPLTLSLPLYTQENGVAPVVASPYGDAWDEFRSYVSAIQESIRRVVVEGGAPIVPPVGEYITNPYTIDDMFRFIAVLSGLWGVMWIEDWSDTAKAGILRQTYSRIWKRKGTRQAIDNAMSSLGFPYILLTYDYDFIVNQPPENPGQHLDLEGVFFLLIPYDRNNLAERTARLVYDVLKPVTATGTEEVPGGVAWTEFLADYSRAGEPVMS